MFAPLNKGRLYQGIIDQITQSVMSGKMRAGDQLPTEPELAEQFGVSRTVVREAMKALSLQGLVDVTPGRGTFVTQPPAEIVITSLLLMLKLEDHSLEDLMAARRLLEAPIARLAAENAQTSDIETLEVNLRGMRTSLNDPDAFLDYDTAFHGHLARATHNTVLTVIAQPIILMMRGIRHSMAAVPDMAMRALHFHQALYEAVVSKDGAAAERCMLEHLEQVAEDLQRARQGVTSREDGNAPNQSTDWALVRSTTDFANAGGIQLNGDTGAVITVEAAGQNQGAKSGRGGKGSHREASTGSAASTPEA